MNFGFVLLLAFGNMTTYARLAPCPDKPNCVSSQAAKSDKQHYIEALTYSGEPARARQRLERAIAGMKRARVVCWSSCNFDLPSASRLTQGQVILSV